MIRKLVLGLVAAGGVVNSGCFINQYPSDPNRRMGVLLNQSEDLRTMGDEWRRFWHNDQPSHLSPDRIHGGI